jgi:hypothetical protein
MAIDLLVVTHDDDLHFLQLQAKSINLSFDYEDINQVIIVHNNLNGTNTSIDKTLYGKFQSKVVDVPFEDLYLVENKVDYLRPRYGWIRQQFCKLLVASYCTVDWCLVIDSKTIFLKKFNYTDFFDNNKRALISRETNHPYFVEPNNWIEKFFNLEPSNYDARLLKRGTPLLMHPSTIRNMIAEMFWRSKTNFFNWFIDYQKNFNISEFDLYFSYIRYKGNEADIYDVRDYRVNDNLVLLQSDEASKFDEKFLNIDRYFSAQLSREFNDKLAYHQNLQWYSFLGSKGIH